MANEWDRYYEAKQAWEEKTRLFFLGKNPSYEDIATYRVIWPPPRPPLSQPTIGAPTPQGGSALPSKPPSLVQCEGEIGPSHCHHLSASSSDDSPSHGKTPSDENTLSPPKSIGGQGDHHGECYGDNQDVEDFAHDASTVSTGTQIFYQIDSKGGLVMNVQGKEVRRYLHELIRSHVRNVYDERSYEQTIIERIIAFLHARYPQSEGRRLNELWLRAHIVNHIANRRSAFTRRAREVLRRKQEGEAPLKNKGKPKKCHNREWVDALKRGAKEQSAQHVAARKIQMEQVGSSRLGSGGLASFIAEFERIVGRYPQWEEEEYRKQHSRKDTWLHFMEKGIISLEQLRRLGFTVKDVSMSGEDEIKESKESDGDEYMLLLHLGGHTH